VCVVPVLSQRERGGERRVRQRDQKHQGAKELKNESSSRGTHATPNKKKRRANDDGRGTFVYFAFCYFYILFCWLGSPLNCHVHLLQLIAAATTTATTAGGGGGGAGGAGAGGAAVAAGGATAAAAATTAATAPAAPAAAPPSSAR
jgi:hypothetical protein